MYMNMKKTFTGIIFCFLLVGLSAQDIHYSMFQMSPVGLNPALAGSFSGTARVGGIYRIQDVISGNSQSISSSRGYETYSAFLDIPVVRGIREQDWIGMGLGLNRDVSGIGNLTETSSIQAISYHYPLDKKRRNVISVGVNSGSLSYKGRNNYTFEDAIVSGGTSFDNNFFEESGGGSGGTAQTKVDWGFGVSYKGDVDRVSAIRTGISAFHLNNPRKKIGSGSGERLPVRITAFAEYDRLINSRTRIIPAMLVQNYKVNTEVAVQALLAYYFDPKNDITVYGGLGLRFNTLNPMDAVPVYVGFDIGDVRARLAYDATISGKGYTNRGFGALEASVNYIIKLYKRPKVDPAVFCPRF